DEPEFARPHVDQERSGDAIFAATPNELDRAMLLQPIDPSRPDLLHEPADDLDAGQVALVHRAIEALPGEGLLVNGAVGVAVEEAAELVLQLPYTLYRDGHERPGELLVVQPLPAFDGVHEVALDRVLGRQRHVVAALNHARAAALAEQPFDRDGDIEIGIRGMGMQPGKEARTAA